MAVTALVALWLAARAAVTIAVVRIRDGRIRVVRGRVAPSIVQALEDVVRRPVVARATIRVVKADGRAEVRMQGALTDEQGQRVRNVIGSVPLAKLVNAG